MDNLNLRNLQLSYQAVYDETLCESMDELGLFGESDYNELNEKTRMNKELGREGEIRIRRKLTKPGKPGEYRGYEGTPPSRNSDRDLKATRYRAAHFENYELYELLLSHILDEGYTDNLESAIAIVENMSDEWIQDIVENKL